VSYIITHINRMKSNSISAGILTISGIRLSLSSEYCAESG
jgi:hypothetical protein